LAYEDLKQKALRYVGGHVEALPEAEGLPRELLAYEDLKKLAAQAEVLHTCNKGGSVSVASTKVHPEDNAKVYPEINAFPSGAGCQTGGRGRGGSRTSEQGQRG
jgi:hypothetical protein